MENGRPRPNNGGPGDYGYDREESDARFKDTVWPTIQTMTWFVGANLRPSQENLDWMSDGDFLLKYTSRLTVVSTRVQRTKNYGTFTLRCERSSGARTQLEKLSDAAKNDGVLPGYVIHGYVQPIDRRVLAVYVVRTKDLLARLENLGFIRVNKQDGNKFVCVYANDLIITGAQVLQYHFDADKFMAKAEEKHRAYWALPPPVQPKVVTPCGRCSGTGRAPSPVGHVQCSLCGGSGEGKQNQKALIK